MVVEYKMVIYHGRIPKKTPTKQTKNPHSLQTSQKKQFSSRGMPTQTLHLPHWERATPKFLSHKRKKRIPTF